MRKDGHVALAGDGQVTLGETVMKASAKKVRRLYNDQILAGFAGATADAFSLLTRFESKLEQYHGNLERAAIELSKEWRTDKMLRHLEALLVVADKKSSFLSVRQWRCDRAGRWRAGDWFGRFVCTGGGARADEAHRIFRRARSRLKLCASPARFVSTQIKISWSKRSVSQASD